MLKHCVRFSRQEGIELCVCRNDMSSGSKLPPSTSSVWEKNTWCHQRGADWIQMCCASLVLSLHFIKELGLRRSFFIISFPPRSHFSLAAQLAALCQRNALLFYYYYFTLPVNLPHIEALNPWEEKSGLTGNTAAKNQSQGRIYQNDFL